MLKMFFALSFPALAMALLAGPTSAQVVFSEGFESPDTANFQTFNTGQTLVTASHSWSITTSGIDLFEDAARAEAAAFEGAQAIDLTGSPGAGVIQTTFATLPGSRYQLTFHYARNNLLGAATGDAQVDVLGTASLFQSTIQHNPATHAFNVYLTGGGTFTADSTQAILRFTSLDPGTTGITLDGIEIQQLPALPLLSDGARLVLIAMLVTLASVFAASIGAGVRRARID